MKTWQTWIWILAASAVWGFVFYQSRGAAWTPHQVIGIAIAVPAFCLWALARLQLGRSFAPAGHARPAGNSGTAPAVPPPGPPARRPRAAGPRPPPAGSPAAAPAPSASGTRYTQPRGAPPDTPPRSTWSARTCPGQRPPATGSDARPAPAGIARTT